MCRSQLFKKYRRVSSFKARIRSAKERRESEEFDNKLMRLFGKYLRYCKYLFSLLFVYILSALFFLIYDFFLIK